jgi:multidrug efflux pump subunit AcrA (membrane-fusion protein)
MKKWFWFGIPIVLVILLVGWRFQVKAAAEAEGGGGPGGAARGGAPGGGGPGGPGGGGRGGAGRTPTVEVISAKGGEIETILETVGSLESPNKANIAPRTTGRIEFLQVREGDRVTAGQVLVRIDPSDIEGQVAQARSSVAEARARLAQAQLGQGPAQAGVAGQIEQQTAAVTSAKADFDQVQRNHEAQIAVAESDVTDNEAQVRSAEAQVKSAEAALTRDRASLANAVARRNRVEQLYKDGFSSLQALEDARTAVQVQEGIVTVTESQVNAARQNVTSANAQLAASKNQLSITKRKGVADIAASKARLAQAQANLKVAQANRAQNPAYRENLEALRQSVRAAEAQLSSAQSRLSETELRAPISGIVTERSADIGSLASPGQAVLVVQSVESVFIRTSLPLDAVNKVFTGQTAKVRIDAYKDEVFTGRISNVNAAADPESRQITALIRLDNAGGKLKPGMFAHVVIVTGSVDADVAVPREAITVTPRGATIAVIGEDMKAQVRNVRLGVQSDTMAEVLDGVKPGERVVVLTFDPLREGQTVQLPGQGGHRSGGSGQGGGGATKQGS